MPDFAQLGESVCDDKSKHRRLDLIRSAARAEAMVTSSPERCVCTMSESSPLLIESHEAMHGTRPLLIKIAGGVASARSTFARLDRRRIRVKRCSFARCDLVVFVDEDLSIKMMKPSKP